MESPGTIWRKFQDEADFHRRAYGPGTDREISAQRQADAIGPEANGARVAYYEELAQKSLAKCPWQRFLRRLQDPRRQIRHHDLTFE
jgi:hypothetical protein